MKAILALAVAFAVTTASGASSGAANSDWLSYNNDLQGQRFSRLAQITTANVHGLRRICSRKLAEGGALQTGPLESGGALYVTTSHDTYALDARTCRVVWANHYVPRDKEPYPVNRGAALAGNRLIRGEPDGHLIAIDRHSGRTVWDVAAARGSIGEWLDAAPVVWNDMVFVGPAASDFGIQGRMQAFDVNTGRVKWTFHTIDPATWGRGQAAKTGGAGTWTSYTLDPTAGELFVPIANPAPALASSYRPGKNLYADSIVVLDAATGKLKWYFQAESLDDHDWDMSAPPVLYTVAGRSMVAMGSKDGYVYGIDRMSHRLVFRTAQVRRLNADKLATPQGLRICPGVQGGTEWNGPAFDPQRALLISPMVDWCATVASGKVEYKRGNFFMGGSVKLDPYSVAHGSLAALRADTGAVLWNTRVNAPMAAGVTPTLGGVIFTGDMAGNFLALETASGHVLYKNRTQGSIAGGVITYAVASKQYVATTSGNVSRFTFPGNIGQPTIVIYSL